MKKQSKIRVGYKKIKQIWKHPKYHALIILSFYIIFFIVISIIIRTGPSEEKYKEIEQVDAITNYADMQNYEYTIEISLNGEINDNNQISGIKYDNINEFEDLKTKNKYYFNGNDLYDKTSKELITPMFYINLNSIKRDNLYLLIKNISENSVIKYGNNEVKKEYIINNITFSDVVIDMLYITTFENDNYINKIEIYFEHNKNTYNIKIDYTNINNITSYESN